ncbi:MAG: hypothetical protein ACRDXX_09355 [Stackebrandtia sp.]
MPRSRSPRASHSGAGRARAGTADVSGVGEQLGIPVEMGRRRIGSALRDVHGGQIQLGMSGLQGRSSRTAKPVCRV